MKSPINDLRDSPRSWQEDFQHENGNYLCSCMECELPFLGYKRRVICRECSIKESTVMIPTPTTTPLNVQRINPLTCPRVEPVNSRWDGDYLTWIIQGCEVPDSALRDWCYQNLELPYNHITVVRQFHVNAYAQAHL